FQLRSERSGPGDGRTYMIVYTASDGSGNTTPNDTEVRVAHDQNGKAKGSDGMNRTGTSFAPGVVSFRLVILSGEGVDPVTILSDAQVGNTDGVVPALSS